jgi:hypothetical protein
LLPAQSKKQTLHTFPLLPTYKSEERRQFLRQYNAENVAVLLNI